MSQGSAPAEGCWAVVPVKRLAAAKSRLAGELDAAERRSLSLAMFEDVLAALRATPGIDATLVVTSDPEVHTYAARAGASVLADPTETNAELAASNDSESGLPSAALSRAVNAGVRAAAGCGASRVLYIAADVPLAAPAAIARLVEPGTADGCIVAARRDQGTNALCVPADVGFGFDFSPQSAALHVAHASARGIRLETLHEPTLALDVDVPADLRELALAAPGGATGRWLAKFQRAVEPTSVPGVTRAAADDFARAPLAELLARAAAIRDARGSPVLTYSRKVFIPLTRLCRDVCHYCTFAKTPRHLEAAYLSRDEVIAIARRGAAAGCAEALFTLGDRPETRYREAREALAALGHRSTVGYLAEVAQLVLEETGLLPHINAGVLSEDEYRELRAVAPSMGLMLETSSARLSERGGAHFGSPDKDPAVRLASIATAGRLKIPFTTGILVGIGETRAERLDSLYALRDLHATYGHLQEIIVQNFVPKPDTLMRTVPALTTEELLWTVAMARLVFGSEMSIQVPPNLNPDAIEALVAAGINDFGGISPVTPDHVNPESPWPEIEVLAATLRSSGRVLVPRLTVYPAYIAARRDWIDPRLHRAVLQHADADGLGGREAWRAGRSISPPGRVGIRVNGRVCSLSSTFASLLTRAVGGERLAETEVVRLFAARESEFEAVLEAADAVRRSRVGDTVTYVVNRNINYTNLCTYHCTFCAFSKGRAAAGLRGPGYLLGLDEIARRTAEAGARGATEVCLQGGIHPSFTGETYLEICRAAKSADPGIHVHAFSPLEIRHGADTLGVPVARFLERLQRAGLATLPGTAAEILDDEVRRELCPDKLKSAEWLEVIGTAHAVGLRTTATIMFGHIETPVSWARHLLAIRDLQARTGGFTEFVPLPFVADEAPLYRKGASRPGPTWREARLMHAVARLVLNPLIENIQASWVKLGPEGARVMLDAGVNDLGGTLMNESISRAAGAAHGQEWPPERISQMVGAAGRELRQRTTLYGTPPPEREARSFGAAPLCALAAPAGRA